MDKAIQTTKKPGVSIPRICLLLAGVLLCLALLASCGGDNRADTLDTLFSMDEMAAAVLKSQQKLPTLSAVRFSSANFPDYLALYFGERREIVVDGIICAPTGAEASEIAIFRMQNETAAEEGAALLRSYLESRIAVFTGYAPEQAALAENGRVVTNGSYAALFVCADPKGAEKAFLGCFGSAKPSAKLEDVLSGESSKSPASSDSSDRNSEIDSSLWDFSGSTDAYDHDAVVAAFRSGEDSLLTKRNRAVLSLCRSVIDIHVKDGMTEYEKELAIHDWMVAYGSYDQAVLYPLLGETPDPNGDNPFGFLLSKKGICLGYTLTFQLFMDLLEIECITVQGYARQTEAHAWNMVRLDGEWYCVDLTWDDPVGTENSASPVVSHKYFNVTSEFMRDTNHQWDEENTPAANATKYSWRSQTDPFIPA